MNRRLPPVNRPLGLLLVAALLATACRAQGGPEPVQPGADHKDHTKPDEWCGGYRTVVEMHKQCRADVLKVIDANKFVFEKNCQNYLKEDAKTRPNTFKEWCLGTTCNVDIQAARSANADCETKQSTCRNALAAYVDCIKGTVEYVRQRSKAAKELKDKFKTEVNTIKTWKQKEEDEKEASFKSFDPLCTQYFEPAPAPTGELRGLESSAAREAGTPTVEAYAEFAGNHVLERLTTAQLDGVESAYKAVKEQENDQHYTEWWMQWFTWVATGVAAVAVGALSLATLKVVAVHRDRRNAAKVSDPFAQGYAEQVRANPGPRRKKRRGTDGSGTGVDESPQPTTSSASAPSRLLGSGSGSGTGSGLRQPGSGLRQPLLQGDS